MAAYGDLTYGAPFPPDSFGTKLAAPLVVTISGANLFPNPVSVPEAGDLVSSVIDVHNFGLIAFGFIAAADLSASIQAFLDLEGTIPVGSPVTISATENGSAQLPSNLVFGSVQITLSNAGSAAVQVSKAMLVARAVNI